MEHGTLTQEYYQKRINGLNNSKRRVVSISGCHKGDDGGDIIIERSRLL